MNDNTRRGIGALFLIGVAAAAFVTVMRQLSIAYMMVEASQEYALAAAFMVVGVIVLTLVAPSTPLVRFAFTSAGAAIVLGMAVAVAPKLGLIEHAPLNWRYALLIAVLSPVVGLLSWAWGAKPKAAKVGEGRRKSRSLSGESNRKSLSIRRSPQSLSAAKAPKELANPDGAGDGPSAAEITKWLETLTVFVDSGGNRAEAARALNMTPPGVSHHLHQLYLVEPELMERKAPEWVERNIKE